MLSGLHQIRKLKVFGAILALSFAFISAHPVFAEVDLELSVNPTLQVVIPTSTVSLTLTPNPDPSIPVFASENLVVSVATNNPTGYSLMLKADSTNLTNTVADREGNYSILPTLVDQVGGYTEESFTTNTWGYRNTNTLLNNTATNNIPDNYNAFTTSSEILSSNLPTNLDQTSLDFAAKVDITQPAGTYELALDFTAVTNMVPGVVTITFDPNTGTGQMPVQQIESGTSQNLTPNTFTKEHYIFTGWNTAPDGTGTHYDNEQSYETVLDVANKSVTLYAQWELETYNITVQGSNATVTGSGTYGYGDTITLTATPTASTTCISYSTPTWTISGAGTLNQTTGESVTFTIGAGDATITATSTASNVQQTITLSRSNATGIKIADTNYTGTSVKLTCGTYALEGVFASGYEFSSWAITGTGNSLTSTTAAKPTLTVGGAGTLTLTGKASQVLIQNVTSANCSGTVYDNRGGVSKAYTVAKIGSLCWMTKNLDLPGGTTLTSADSNVTSNYTLPASSTSGFSSDSTAYVYNSNSTTCGNGSPCYSYYSYVAATAGTNPSLGNDATSDICPKGWRLPTHGELTTLRSSYTTGATLTASPFLGVYAGYYSNSSFGSGGSTGFYWSSLASSSTFAYYLYFNSSDSLVTDNYKYYGFSVRCVAKS